MSELPAHRSAGWHGLLERPALYRLLQVLLGARRSRRILVERYVRPGLSDRVLDLGCGTADLLELFPSGTRYTGLDLNPRYVAMAQRRYGGRGRFLCGGAGEVPDEHLGGPFDRILLVALLHHLEDSAADRVLRQAARLLAPEGVLVTIDNVLVESSSPIARWLIASDRGARVRSPAAYRELLGRSFPAVECEVRRDLLRVPYVHFVARAALREAALSRG